MEARSLAMKANELSTRHVVRSVAFGTETNGCRSKTYVHPVRGKEFVPDRLFSIPVGKDTLSDQLIKQIHNQSRGRL